MTEFLLQTLRTYDIMSWNLKGEFFEEKTFVRKGTKDFSIAVADQNVYEANESCAPQQFECQLPALRSDRKWID